MAASLVYEAHTQASENFTNSFFAKLPMDTTKNNVRVERILPATALDNETTNIVFNLPPKGKCKNEDSFFEM